MDLVANFLSAFFFSFAVMTLPSTFSFLIIIHWMKHLTKDDPVIKKIHGTTAFVRYIFSIDTSKGLSSQGLFWFSILVPFMYFLMLGFIGWRGYSLRLDAEGFKTFISISALPLGILSLAVPLSAIVGRFHTSKQTAKQISIVSQKNNIDLYHSHRKELFSFFDQIGSFELNSNLTARNKVHPRLHKQFFKGDPKDGMPTANLARFQEVNDLLSTTRNNLIAILLDVNPNITFNFYIEFFCRDMFFLAYHLGLQEIINLATKSPRFPCIIKGEKLNLETIGTTSDDAICAFRCAENFFQNLCDFANFKASYFNDPEDEKNLTQAIRNKSIPLVIENIHRNIIEPAIQKEAHSA